MIGFILRWRRKIPTMGFLQLSAFFFLLTMAACVRNDDDPSLKLNDDVLGLIVFKSGIKDPFSYLDSWDEDDSSPCSWRFVRCNPFNGRVSEISLNGLGLSGKIGKGLQKLQFLKVLSLSHNDFNGSIDELGSVYTSLESLNLSHNGFSGKIPSFFAMDSIKFLDLSGNFLTGPIPDDLFQTCSSLEVLSLAENSLQGTLPTTLSQCSNLKNLNLSKNQLSGTIKYLGSMNKLQTLDLSYNSFSGIIPEKALAAINDLKELRLQSNHFTGPIPDSIQSLKKSISSIDLSNNMFTGDFPQWIGKLSNLEHLDFSANSLTGNLPPSIGNLKALKQLKLSNNKLEGNIPPSLSYCFQLSAIDLRDNGFNGSIPPSLFQLQSLQDLDISRNNLQGNIIAETGIFAKIKYLNLSWNNLRSKIPPEIGLLQNLTMLDLRNNGLLGGIPRDLCEAGNLGVLQLDGNSLTGPIPDEIGNCSSLYLLSLSHNNVSGSIPKSMSKLSMLKILNLEYNEISGEIPYELGFLGNLLAVNLSYNQLTGRLPTRGIFPSLDQSSIMGNLGLCSPLLKGPCKMNTPKPLVLDPDLYNEQMGDHRRRNESSSNTRFGHRMFFSVSAIIAISAAVLIVSGVIIISLLNVSARRRQGMVEAALESMCSSSTRSGSLPTGKLIMFDSKLLPDGVDNPEVLLEKASEIGEGVFGSVYKVSLGAHGRFMAIKRLVTSKIIEYPDDFDREVRVLSKARHPNLIALEGYYWTPHCQLLVTEYASNGNLQTKLHERLSSTPALSWPERFKIILGTAKGLAYLHHSFRPPIIHYNMKPSNILLDENNSPKISDFGLARLLTKLEKHVINNRFQSALGYVAPELACQSLRVNEKCDIYSFGVLILEIVTGRRPVEYGEDNVVILSDHVRISLEQGNVLDCVDRSMSDYPEDEVLPMMKLALVCTSQIPSSRPSMTEVVQILQVIKTPIPHQMEIF